MVAIKELLDDLGDAVAAVGEQLVRQEGVLVAPVLGLRVRVRHNRQEVNQLLQSLLLRETILNNQKLATSSQLLQNQSS